MDTEKNIFGIENYIFTWLSILPVVFAIITSLFLGKEHSNGNLRNKITVGYTRFEIYMSNFTISLFINLIITAFWIVGNIPGFIKINHTNIGIDEILKYFVVILFVDLSFAAINVFISSNLKKESSIMVVTFFSYLLLYKISENIYNDLLFIRHYAVEKMHLYILKLESLPTGQILLCNDLAMKNFAGAIFISIIFTLLCLMLGYVIFARKDLE